MARAKLRAIGRVRGRSKSRKPVLAIDAFSRLSPLVIGRFLNAGVQRGDADRRGSVQAPLTDELLDAIDDLQPLFADSFLRLRK